MAPPSGFDANTPRDRARRILSGALAEAGVPSADLDARLLLCAALGLDHAGLLRDPGAPLGARGAQALERMAARRLAREPTSRILGAREFWGARFHLGPAALDPRPDTETLVEVVLDAVGAETGRAWRILDLGVGSGALLCALLASLPNAFGVGVDLAPAACAIADRNLAAQGLQGRGKLICADWAAPLEARSAARFDIIVSNPPYISRGDIARLEPEVRIYDPLLALDGGEDGLDAYRAVIPTAARLLAPEGFVALEIGQGQGKDVDALLRDASFSARNFRLDLGGVERIILAKFA
ncbi:protein-(glutamine-N5) methyltransferase, release factor-specific [Methylocella silvestris BL2]|uniref:Release factor glutamine methyltransferase n=1 Tax=Methylocella silvestris (strain DSM 15510 / CIP 108128 / LMG 27833 / NCIMB 13906 / BL2) TaxID=395965 RepID=B8ENR8_METSB|nr:protein-(glutamine-N5) methyltransferase, release factor-specific [Methylocella silvestris BL2]